MKPPGPKISPQGFNPRNHLSGIIAHKDPTFHSFTVIEEKVILRAATPPILMSKRVYDGYKAACPSADAVRNDWYKSILKTFKYVPDSVCGAVVD